MRGRLCGLLLVSLAGLSCSLFGSEELPPGWVERDIHSTPPLRDILSECEAALHAAGFPQPFHRDDLARVVNSGWDVAPHPFSRKGLRRRGVFQLDPLEGGGWSLRARVEVEKNEEVHMPLELDAAKWEAVADDLVAARVILQHAITRLRRAGARIG